MSNLEQDGFHPTVAAQEYQKKALEIRASLENGRAEAVSEDAFVITDLVAKMSQIQLDVYTTAELLNAISSIDEALWKGRVTLDNFDMSPQDWKKICKKYKMHSNYMSFALPEVFGEKREMYGEIEIKRFPGCQIQVEIRRGMNGKGFPAVRIQTYLKMPNQLPQVFLDFSGEAVGIESRHIADFLGGLRSMAEIELETLGKLEGIYEKN